MWQVSVAAEGVTMARGPGLVAPTADKFREWTAALAKGLLLLSLLCSQEAGPGQKGCCKTQQRSDSWEHAVAIWSPH